MQVLPGLRSSILERLNFLEENVLRLWPSHNFGFLREIHKSLLLGWAHASVCTSTESTPGRPRTIGDQLSPASAEAYTGPPLAPKYKPNLSSGSAATASRNTLTKQLLCGRPLVSISPLA